MLKLVEIILMQINIFFCGRGKQLALIYTVGMRKRNPNNLDIETKLNPMIGVWKLIFFLFYNFQVIPVSYTHLNKGQL